MINFKIIIFGSNASTLLCHILVTSKIAEENDLVYLQMMCKNLGLAHKRGDKIAFANWLAKFANGCSRGYTLQEFKRLVPGYNFNGYSEHELRILMLASLRNGSILVSMSSEFLCWLVSGMDQYFELMMLV